MRAKEANQENGKQGTEEIQTTIYIKIKESFAKYNLNRNYHRQFTCEERMGNKALKKSNLQIINQLKINSQYLPKKFKE
jgi:hypothetical protein